MLCAVFERVTVRRCLKSMTHDTFQNQRLCFHRRQSVSLFVSRITQKLLNGVSQNSTERWHTGRGRNCYILVV